MLSVRGGFLGCFVISVALLITSKLHPQEVRALWVTRWDYRGRQDIETIMQNATETHFNLILFQVRGNGTVFYPSAIEPPARELNEDSLSWNPLKIAIEEAHKRNLQLHAWINVFPGWRGTKIPTDSSYLIVRHPDWFMVEEDGAPMPLNSHYVWLNPQRQDVKRYLKRVILELADTPGLDGIHFDYFRYPGPGVSYDSLSKDCVQTSRFPGAVDSLARWNRFRTRAITSFLRQIRKDLERNYPNLILSSAVIGDYDLAMPLFFQDSHRWLNEGIIDVLFPMVYTKDIRLLQRWLQRHWPYQYHGKILPGLMVYGDSHLLLDQIRLVRNMGFDGISLFSYSVLFPGHIPSLTALALKESAFPETTPVPDLKNRSKLPVVLQTLYSPTTVTSRDSILLICQISPSPSQDSQRVAMVVRSLVTEDSVFAIHMVPLSRDSTFFYAKRKFCWSRAGDVLEAQAFIIQKYKPRKVLAKGEPIQIPISENTQTVTALGSFGPLLRGVSKGAIDTQNRVWVFEPGKGIRIFALNGTEITTTPIRSYLDNNMRVRHFSAVVDLQFVPPDRIWILAQSNGERVLLENHSNAINLIQIRRLPYKAMDMAASSTGELFLLQANGWISLNQKGEMSWQERFAMPHTVNNIACSPEGRRVYVACRTESRVHVWEKEPESASFHQVKDLPIPMVSTGFVNTGLSGELVVALPPLSTAAFCTSDFLQPIFLHSTPRILQAPRQALLSPDGHYIVVLEMGGTTSVRMKLLSRQE